MPTTIKDIAKRLRVSPSTVSRALNNKPGISKKTISAVNVMAQKLNYKPNSVAVSLRQHRSNCIGVVVPKISNHFFSEAIGGIQEIAVKSGYQLLISQTNDTIEEEINAINALNSGRVDGILLSIGAEVSTLNHIKALSKELPVVLFDRATTKFEVSCVTAEDYEGAYRLTRHLIQTGRKRIVHLAGPRNLEIIDARYRGYKNALSKHKIPLKNRLVVECDFDVQKVDQAIRDLVIDGVKFDAIFASNDDKAVQAILTLDQLGIKVPDQVAVAGFGNYAVSNIVKPNLTTINHQPRKMGALAAKILLAQMNQNQDISKSTVSSELIVRDST
ncbi:MAG: LacI family DNA-binding transcriptional regulator [Bacteroidota bacterium]